MPTFQLSDIEEPESPDATTPQATQPKQVVGTYRLSDIEEPKAATAPATAAPQQTGTYRLSDIDAPAPTAAPATKTPPAPTPQGVYDSSPTTYGRDPQGALHSKWDGTKWVDLYTGATVGDPHSTETQQPPANTAFPPDEDATPPVTFKGDPAQLATHQGLPGQSPLATSLAGGLQDLPPVPKPAPFVGPIQTSTAPYVLPGAPGPVTPQLPSGLDKDAYVSAPSRTGEFYRQPLPNPGGPLGQLAGIHQALQTSAIPAIPISPDDRLTNVPVPGLGQVPVSALKTITNTITGQANVETAAVVLASMFGGEALAALANSEKAAAVLKASPILAKAIDIGSRTAIPAGFSVYQGAQAAEGAQQFYALKKAGKTDQAEDALVGSLTNLAMAAASAVGAVHAGIATSDLYPTSKADAGATDPVTGEPIPAEAVGGIAKPATAAQAGANAAALQSGGQRLAAQAWENLDSTKPTPITINGQQLFVTPQRRVPGMNISGHAGYYQEIIDADGNRVVGGTPDYVSNWANHNNATIAQVAGDVPLRAQDLQPATSTRMGHESSGLEMPAQTEADPLFGEKLDVLRDGLAQAKTPEEQAFYQRQIQEHITDSVRGAMADVDAPAAQGLPPEFKPVDADGTPQTSQTAPSDEGTPALKDTDNVHQYSNSQANLQPGPMLDKIDQFVATIAPDKVSEKPGEGEETKHITIKYGNPGTDPAPIAQALQGEGPATATIGNMHVFPGKDGEPDALVALIDKSDDLHRMNAKVGAAVDHTGSTFPDYKPHITLKYLKPGEGKDYDGRPIPGVTGQTITLPSVTFSGKDGKQTEIPLTGQPYSLGNSQQNGNTIVSPSTPQPSTPVDNGVSAGTPSTSAPSGGSDVAPTNENGSTIPPDAAAQPGRAGTEGQGGSLQETGGAIRPARRGEATSVVVPGTDTEYPAQYGLRELSELTPSHSGFSFQPNSSYAPYVNDRDYTKQSNQLRVIGQAQKFNPRFLITDNPDAVNGPPVVDADGKVLGGNSRVMTMQRVYGQHPEHAANYRALLAKQAAHYGIDPAQLASMKEPVLVREMTEEHALHVQRTISDLNKTGTADLGPSEQALVDSKHVSPETLDFIEHSISSQGEDGSLAKALAADSGPEIVNRLVTDGLITPQEAPHYIANDKVTPEGKTRIGRLMIGRFFNDVRQFDETPVSIKNKLEKAVTPLARLEQRPEWDQFNAPIREALKLMDEARAHNLTKIEDVDAQQTLEGQPSKYSPAAYQWAHALKDNSGKALTDAFKSYAEMESRSRPDTTVDMFGPPPVSQSEAFQGTIGKLKGIAAPGTAAAKPGKKQTLPAGHPLAKPDVEESKPTPSETQTGESAETQAIAPPTSSDEAIKQFQVGDKVTFHPPGNNSVVTGTVEKVIPRQPSKIPGMEQKPALSVRMLTQDGLPKGHRGVTLGALTGLDPLDATKVAATAVSQKSDDAESVPEKPQAAGGTAAAAGLSPQDIIDALKKKLAEQQKAKQEAAPEKKPNTPPTPASIKEHNERAAKARQTAALKAMTSDQFAKVMKTPGKYDPALVREVAAERGLTTAAPAPVTQAFTVGQHVIVTDHDERKRSAVIAMLDLKRFPHTETRDGIRVKFDDTGTEQTLHQDRVKAIRAGQPAATSESEIRSYDLVVFDSPQGPQEGNVIAFPGDGVYEVRIPVRGTKPGRSVIVKERDVRKVNGVPFAPMPSVTPPSLGATQPDQEKKPSAAIKPENPFASAADAERERMRKKFGTKKRDQPGTLQSRDPNAPTVDPDDLMGLATIGMQHMVDGAKDFNEWTQRVMADVGDLVDAIADASDQKPEDVLREVHGYAAAAVNDSGLGLKIEPAPAKKKAELAPSTEILERYTNKEDGTEAVIAKTPQGYSVVLRDTDADETLPQVTIYPTLEAARAKAKELVGQKDAQPEPHVYKGGDLVNVKRGITISPGYIVNRNADGNYLVRHDPAALPEGARNWGQRTFIPADLSPRTAPEAKPGGAPALIQAVYKKLQAGESLGNITKLNELAEQHFGSSRTSGLWTPKDAFDAMEAGVNKWLIERGKDLLDMPFNKAMTELRGLMDQLTSQAGVRTDDQIDNQQFSTPPTESFVVAKLADLKPTDVVLEPSAGNGGLAVWPKALGTEVYVNEISPRRREMLQAIGFGKASEVDGELINALLDPAIKPTVVMMNPPFSASTLKSHTAPNRSQYGFNHVDQALQRLLPGGRLVVILGGGHANDAEGGASLTSGPSGKWFDRIAKIYNVRANVRISGKEYQKYGTTFATRIIVIDKDGPTPSKVKKNVPESWDSVQRGNVETLEEAYNLLRHVAESRPQVELVPRGNDGLGTGQSGTGLDRDSDGVHGSDSGLPDGQRGNQEDGGTPGQPGDLRGHDGELRPGDGNQSPGGVEPGSESEGHHAPAAADNPESDVAHADDERPAPLALNPDTAEPEPIEVDEGDSPYVPYRPTLAGTPHPGDIVETRTMATVPMPPITYTPNLPDWVTKTGKLSAVQLEAIALVGQQNSIVLPNGAYSTALIGDGTGVGKGRIAAGILWDNYRQGRRRLVWVSEKWDLMQDAIRDLRGISLPPGTVVGTRDLMRGITEVNGKNVTASDSAVKPFNSYPYGKPVNQDGIIFSTYATVRGEDKKGNRRADQLGEYLRGDDDGEGGYILFDESHNLKNSTGVGASIIGQRVKELLDNMPHLRTASLSATAATDVANLGYLDRLGLWGPGTPFPQGFGEFQTQIAPGGLAAMELIARELKAQGKYVSRTLSYKGVTYSQEIHHLSDDQKALYRTAVSAWQSVVQAAENTIANTTRGSSRQTGNFMSAFGGAQQRFFGLLITALKAPTCIDLANKALADGKSVVITLVNTNEAAQTREKNKERGEDEDGDEPPDYDFGPKEMLKTLVEQNYPIQQFKDDVDDDGHPIRVPVWTTDSEGRRAPVNNPQAIAERDALLAQIDRDLHMPDNPLDTLINSLGGEKAVAEITGRKEKVDSTTGKFVKRGDPKASQKEINLFEMRAFQGGKKRVAILSSAGGTGISLHAGNDVANQQKRYHITLQVGWSADKAQQMLGRTHRTNQKQAPEYTFLISDLAGEQRFVSTILRRLGSLGALTKGQKNAAAGSAMGDSVNIETEQGKAATNAFYVRLLQNIPVPGTDLTGMQILNDLRVLKMQQGQLTVPNQDRTNVTKLLNRLLAIDPDRQKAVFKYFFDIFNAAVDKAIQDGTLDTGVKTLPGDEIHVKEHRVIGTDPKTGAATFYYPVDSKMKTDRLSPDALDERMVKNQSRNPAIMRDKEGQLSLVMDAPPIVRDTGAVDPAFYASTPGQGRWVKVSQAEYRRTGGRQEVTAWAADEVKKAQTKVSDAEATLKRHRTELENGTKYAREPKIRDANYDLRDAERHLEESKALSPEMQFGTERNARLTGNVDQAKAALAKAQAYELPANDWRRASVNNSEKDLAEAQPALAAAQEIAKDPDKYAKDEWKKAYDAAPSHITREHHMIGGAVMRFWNPIRDAAHIRDSIYTTTDSKTNQRVVGIDIPAAHIRQLLDRITGGKSMVDPKQLHDDVLLNNLRYTLEGGIQVLRGRVARTNVIQLIPPNQNVARTLVAQGVIHEKGVQPIYYIPNYTGEYGKQTGGILARILGQYPVKDDAPAAVQAREEGPKSGIAVVPESLQARALPGDQPLFSTEEEDASRSADQSHKDKVLGSQLTAQLKSGMAAKPSRLKPQTAPRGLFEEDNAPEQSSLFSKRPTSPDQLSLFDERSTSTDDIRRPAQRSTTFSLDPASIRRLPNAPLPKNAALPTMAELNAFWDGTGARTGNLSGRPALFVNNAGMEIVLRRMGQLGSGESADQTLGITLAPSEWHNILQEAQAAAHDPRKGGFDDALIRVANQIRKTLGKPALERAGSAVTEKNLETDKYGDPTGREIEGSETPPLPSFTHPTDVGEPENDQPLIVVQAGENIAGATLKRIAEEEFDHASQMQLPGGLAGLPAYVVETPEGLIAARGLARIGYPKLNPESPFYKHNRALIAAEIGARLMRPGRWQELGLTAQQARDLAQMYAEGLAKHGARAEGIVNQIYESLAQETYSPRTGPVQAQNEKAGEVGTAKPRGPPGSTGRDVSGQPGALQSRAGDIARKAVDAIKPAKDPDEPELNVSRKGVFKDKFVRNLSQLETTGSDKVHAAAVQLATTRAQASALLHAAIPRIEEALTKDGPSWQDFRRTLTEDRLRGIREFWAGMADKMDHTTSDELRPGSKFGDWMIHLLKAIRPEDDELSPPQTPAETVVALLQQGDLDGVREFVGQAFSRASERVARVMTPDEYDGITANPHFAAGLAAYKKLLEQPLADSHEDNEGFFTQNLGPLNTYIPLIPMTDGELTKQKVGRSGRAVPYRKPRNIDNNFATGLSDDYSMDPEALAGRIANSLRVNNKAALMEALQGSNLARKLKRGEETPDTIRVRGVDYKAVAVDIGKDRDIQRPTPQGTIHIPAEKMLIPAWLEGELHSILDKQNINLSDPKSIMATITKWTLAGPFDVFIHSANLLGTLVANTPFLGSTLTQKAVGNFPFAKRFSAMFQVATTNPHTQEAATDIQEMAKLGILPEKYGSVASAWTEAGKHYAETTGAELSRLFTPILYGPGGIDVRARLAMYRLAKAINPDAPPKEMYLFVNQLGNYTRALQGKVERSWKESGWSPFYTAGSTMVRNGINAWAMNGPTITPKGGPGGGKIPTGKNGRRLMRVLAQITGGAAGLVALWMAVHKAYTGKWPQQDPHSKFLAVRLNPEDRASKLAVALYGPPSTGDAYVDIGFFSPLVKRGARALGIAGMFEASQAGGSFGQKMDAAVTGAIDAAWQPFMGPPAKAAWIGLFGTEPHLSGLSDDRGKRMPQFTPAVKPQEPTVLGFAKQHILPPLVSMNNLFSNFAAATGLTRGVMPNADDKTNHWIRMIVDMATPQLFSQPSDTLSHAEFLARQREGAHETKRNDTNARITDAIRSGDTDKAREMAKKALADGLISMDDLDKSLKDSEVPHTVTGYKALSLMPAIEVMGVADPEERKTFMPILREKYENKFDARPAAEQDRIHEALRGLKISQAEWDAAGK